MGKGIHYEYVLISKEELCGKYKHISHKSGKNYAKVWYNDDEIYPYYTYTN